MEGAILLYANLIGAKLIAAQVADEQLSETEALKGALMPNKQKYDGVFNLEGDIQAARSEGVNVDNPEAMAAWYAGEAFD